MSIKITPSKSDVISPSLQENKNLEDLNVNELFKIYLAEVGDINNLQNTVELNGLEYDVETNKLKHNDRIKNYQQRVNDLKDNLIDEIQTIRQYTSRRKDKSKALSKVAEIKLKKLSEVDRLRLENQELKRQNQMLLNYIKSISNQLIPQKQQEIKSLIKSKQTTLEHNKPLIIEGIKNNVPEILPIPSHPTEPFTSAPISKKDSPTKLEDVKLKQLSENNKLKLRVELERENQILKDYIQTIRSKQIVEGISKRIPKHPSINKIRKAQANIPTPPKELIKLKPYGESKAFVKEHCNMNFEEWRKPVGNSTNEKQMDLVNKTIDNIHKSPLKWQIDLYKFNDYGLEELVEPLVDILENEVSKLISANQKMMTHYLIGQTTYSEKVGKESTDKLWHSKPLSYDSFNDLINNIREHGFKYDMDDQNTYDSSTSNIKTILSICDIISFEVMKIYKKTYKSAKRAANAKTKSGANRPSNYSGDDGGFFPYWNLSNGIIDLSRYQILDKINSIYNNKIHRIPCVFYALEQLVNDGIITKGYAQIAATRCQHYLTWDWTNNFYNSQHLNKLCNELRIYCKIHYIKDDNINNEIRTKDVGVTKDKSKYQIELGYYKEHYFIYEKTNYTKYFIQHFEELKDIKDANKIIGKRRTGTYQRDSRASYYLNSLEILREMMKCNLFEKMTFQDILNLKKPVDLNTPIYDLVPKNMVWVGMKFLANGDMVPDLVYKDDEDELFG